jgi:hypothetical protein
MIVKLRYPMRQAENDAAHGHLWLTKQHTIGTGTKLVLRCIQMIQPFLSCSIPVVSL